MTYRVTAQVHALGYSPPSFLLSTLDLFTCPCQACTFHSFTLWSLCKPLIHSGPSTTQQASGLALLPRLLRAVCQPLWFGGGLSCKDRCWSSVFTVMVLRGGWGLVGYHWVMGSLPSEETNAPCSRGLRTSRVDHMKGTWLTCVYCPCLLLLLLRGVAPQEAPPEDKQVQALCSETFLPSELWAQINLFSL